MIDPGKMMADNLQVWIADVETNLPLTEYETKTSVKNTFNRDYEVSSYIPSFAGQRFKICLNVSRAYTQFLGCQVYIDGQWCAGVSIPHSVPMDTCIVLDAIDAGPGRIIRLMFGKSRTSSTPILMN